MNDLTLGILGGLGSAVCWASITVLGRAISGSISPAAINAVRSVLGGLLVVVIAVAAGYGPEIVRIPLWALLAFWVSMAIGFAIGDTVFFAGMEHLGVTRAHTLSMVHPLLTTLIGIGLLGEPISITRAVGILLVLGGLLLIVSGRGEDSPEGRASQWRGVRLVLVAALSWTIAAVLLKAPLQGVSAMAATAVRGPMGGVVLLLTPWARGAFRAVRGCRPPELTRLAVICLLSFGSALSFTAGVKHAGVAVGTVLATTSPLFTIPLEIFVLGHRPSGRTILGAVITVAGIALINL
jgi:drug/metabolite transporter (DMT)-like permease